MKYYNLLYFGLIRLAEKTTYKEISEYVAAWGMALILELNLIVIVGTLSGSSILLKPHILIPIYLFLIFLGVLSYKKQIATFRELRKKFDSSQTQNPNINFPEGLALFFIVESVTMPLLFMRL